MGVFAGFNAATITMVASQVPPRRLGYALGWLSTGQLVGTLLGPLAGGGIADLTGSYRMPFVFTSAVCLLCGVVVLTMVRERFTPPKAGAARAGLLAGFALLGRTPGLVPLFVVLLLAQFAVQAVQPVVTVFVEQLLGDRPDLATLGGLAFSITGGRGRDRVAVPGAPQRHAGIPPGAADLLGRRRADECPAVLRHELLELRRGTVRARPVHRRHPADGERACGTAGPTAASWRRLWGDRPRR